MDAAEIKEAVKEAIKETRGDFYIDPKNHYDDHSFTKSARSALRKIRTGGFVSLGASIVAFIIYSIQSWVGTNTPTP